MAWLWFRVAAALLRLPQVGGFEAYLLADEDKEAAEVYRQVRTPAQPAAGDASVRVQPGRSRSAVRATTQTAPAAHLTLSTPAAARTTHRTPPFRPAPKRRPPTTIQA